MKIILALALAATTVQPSPGFGPQRPCLTSAEAQSLATFVLPGIIDGLAKRCRGSLGRDAYLRRPDADLLSARLRGDAAASWPSAKFAMEKLGGGRLPTLFGDGFIRDMAEATAADLVLRDFDKADCGAIDGLIAGLAPLPSANFSNVMAALIALGGGREGADAALRICPVTATR